MQVTEANTFSPEGEQCLLEARRVKCPCHGHGATAHSIAGRCWIHARHLPMGKTNINEAAQAKLDEAARNMKCVQLPALTQILVLGNARWDVGKHRTRRRRWLKAPPLRARRRSKMNRSRTKRSQSWKGWRRRLGNATARSARLETQVCIDTGQRSGFDANRVQICAVPRSRGC